MVLLRGVRGVCWLIRSVSLSAPLLARQAGVLARRHGGPRLTHSLGCTIATSRYALAAACVADHLSLNAPPSAASWPAAVCGALFISPDHFRSQAVLVATRVGDAVVPPPRSHSVWFSTHQ